MINYHHDWIKSTNSCVNGQFVIDLIWLRGGTVGCVFTLNCWYLQPSTYFLIECPMLGHQYSQLITAWVVSLPGCLVVGWSWYCFSIIFLKSPKGRWSHSLLNNSLSFLLNSGYFWLCPFLRSFQIITKCSSVICLLLVSSSSSACESSLMN
jgi:hypothetical protein